MQAVILAGGTGKRVFPLAVNKPKPMFKVLGKPLIRYVIETMKEADLRNFIIVIGHNGEQIKNYLGDGREYGVNIEYTFQKEALGMANALETAKEIVDDNFFVVNADDIFETSLIRDMLRQLKKSGAEIVLSCKPVKETWKYGIIQVETDSVREFVEKPPKGQEPSNLAVIGAYIVSKKIFGYLGKVPVSDHQYEDAIQEFIEDKGLVKAVRYEAFFSAYKYPWDLFTINNYLMDKHVAKQVIGENVKVSERAVVEGNVWIGQGTKVLEGACIRGPCYIGSNSLVGNNVLIWKYSSIGNNSVIGFSSEIKHSLIGDNCWFHMNYVGDSILSDYCSFGAGAVTANLRFDEKNIKMRINEAEIDSGRDKLGVIMADNSKTGVNVCLMPGVRVGPHSIVGPNVCLYNDLGPNKIILQDKSGYVVEDNKMTVSPEKRKELMKRLMKYQ